MIGPLLFHGIRADLSGCPGVTVVDRQSMNNLLDFKLIYCMFPLNNSICIIGRNCRSGGVIGVFSKCSGLRPSDTWSSCWLAWRRHANSGKQLFVKSYDLSLQSVTVVISIYVCLYWIKGIVCSYVIRSGRHVYTVSAIFAMNKVLICVLHLHFNSNFQLITKTWLFLTNG